MEDITRNVIESIAESKGVPPSELDFVLHDYIDPEALDLLASHDGGPWTLSLELPEHEVTITSDGLILINGRKEGAWQPSIDEP